MTCFTLQAGDLYLPVGSFTEKNFRKYCTHRWFTLPASHLCRWRSSWLLSPYYIEAHLLLIWYDFEFPAWLWDTFNERFTDSQFLTCPHCFVRYMISTNQLLNGITHAAFIFRSGTLMHIGLWLVINVPCSFRFIRCVRSWRKSSKGKRMSHMRPIVVSQVKLVGMLAFCRRVMWQESLQPCAMWLLSRIVVSRVQWSS